MVGGARLAPSRPIAGGVLVGLLAYKPHFGFLVVIALIAAGWRRTALAAAFTVFAWAAATLLAFGFEPWLAWLRAIPDYLAIQYSLRDKMIPLMPTPMANALDLGAGHGLATAIQLTAIAAAAVWYAFSSARPALPSTADIGGGAADRAAVLATASILATPYALIYDTTLVGAAVAIVVAETWVTLSVVEALVLALAALMPVGRMLGMAPPVGAAAHGLLLALILLRLRRAAAQASGQGAGRLVSS